MSFDAKRTQVAQSAFDFSRYFSGIFGAIVVNGAVPRRPILAIPEGMSTAGGKRARQSIVLQPEDGASAVVTVGWVDIGERRAMLRSFNCLNELHQERFRSRPFDVDMNSYNAFFNQGRSFLTSCGFAVQVENDAQPLSRQSLAEMGGPASNRPPPATASSSNSALVGTAMFFAGILVGGFLVYARFTWLK